MNLGITAGGYVASLALLWLWIGAERDHAAAIEECNTRTVEAAREAEELAREATARAAQEEIDRQRGIAQAQAKAREMVSQALREAESREPEIRTVIQEVNRGTSAEKCLDLPIPRAIRDRLLD